MSDRPRWQVPVLVLAIVLIVGQVIVFVAIRKGSKDTHVDSTVALAPAEGSSLPQGSSMPADPLPPLPSPPVVVDANVEVSTPDATEATVPIVAPEHLSEPAPKKKITRAELAAQKKKEREEQERDAREAREAREARDRKADQDRAAEKARLDNELERQRLATQKAEADAIAAKAAVEKARLEAVAKIEPVQPAVKPAPDVLVLVLGPGTPSVSSEQIRAVFLGRTSVWPNGTTARPFNRPGGTAAARKFYGGILQMSGGDFREHWSEIQLSGNGIPPPLAGSGANAVAKVAATQGGFTYVMESELPANTNGVRLVRLK